MECVERPRLFFLFFFLVEEALGPRAAYCRGKGVKTVALVKGFPLEAVFGKAHFLGFLMVAWKACRDEGFSGTARGVRRSNRAR